MIEEWQTARRRYISDFQQVTYGIGVDNHLAVLAAAAGAGAPSDSRGRPADAAGQLLPQLRQQLAEPAKQIADGMSLWDDYSIIIWFLLQYTRTHTLIHSYSSLGGRLDAAL